MTFVIGMLVVGAGAIWALGSLRPEDLSTPPAMRAKQPLRAFPTEDRGGLDLDVFSATLWHVTPQPIVAAGDSTTRSEPVSPPLHLQLVGIIEERGRFHAALYDPDANRLLILGDGESIGSHAITRVTADTVELEHHGDHHVLHLLRRRRSSHEQG